MTIIYSNLLDDDCIVLREIWEGFNNVKVKEIVPTSKDYENKIDNAIFNEKDTLICCGHGTSYGLLFPDFNRGEYIIHENNVNLINAKNVIFSWCYASNFAINHPNVTNCFATSMFISNEHEAIDNGIYDYSQDQINANGLRFYQEINYLLKNDIPLNEWVMRLGAHADIENAIDMFNRQILHYQ